MSLYGITHQLLNLGFWFFFRKVHVNQVEHVPLDGPVLLVANHPNSFMDALIIAAKLSRPTHFLARGDAFNNPILAKIFHAYNMLPVYRISEGKENLEKNFETFDASFDALANNGMVLIFGEGLCKNNWDLRPLKKGPGRIAHRAWNSNTSAKNLKIVPVGLTYEHFDGGGKSVVVNYGKPIGSSDFDAGLSSSALVQQLNEKIVTQITSIAYINKFVGSNTPEHTTMMGVWQQAEKNNKEVLSALNNHEKSGFVYAGKKRWFTKIHLGLIALPHYWLMMLITKKLTKNSVFYDSVLFGLVLFLFPLYWLFLALLISYFI
jgi:1-acyl-sn-glycerol-3-phosphate acyltransferase